MIIQKAALDIKKEQTIKVPRGSTFLYAKEQGTGLYVWYKAPHENAPKEPRRIVILKTGEETDIPMALLNPLGCVMFYHGSPIINVYHIFFVMSGYVMK